MVYVGRICFCCFVLFYKFAVNKCFWTSDIDKDNLFLLKTYYMSDTLPGILYTWTYKIIASFL